MSNETATQTTLADETAFALGAEIKALRDDAERDTAEIARLRALLADVMAPIEAGALVDTAAGKNFRDSRTAAAIREELARAK